MPNVLITGAAQGIGKAIALRLARDGHNVLINDVSRYEAEAKVTARLIESFGRRSGCTIGDVSISNQVNKMVADTVSTLGSLDIMIANAGIAEVKPLLDTTSDEWDRMMAVNLRGVFLCYTAAARQMISQGKGGKIIGAASIVAYRPFALLAPYSTSKWGVRGLTQAGAMEWGKYGITVNAYCPGIVGTAMWDLIDEKLAKIHGKSKGEMIKKFSEELIALGGRTSVPEDVAKFVSYLASTNSDYMTGQSIMIDGGICFS